MGDRRKDATRAKIRLVEEKIPATAQHLTKSGNSRQALIFDAVGFSLDKLNFFFVSLSFRICAYVYFEYADECSYSSFGFCLPANDPER